MTTMPTLLASARRLAVLAAVFAAMTIPLARAQQSPRTGGGARISGLRTVHTNLAVTVQVPAGVRRITLESRPRLGGGT